MGIVWQAADVGGFLRSCTRLTSTAALARSNSSSSDWCLESRVLPQRCSFVRRACHTHMHLIVWTFMQCKKKESTIYAPVLNAHIHILQQIRHTYTTWRRGGQGECAGSASSAFSGRLKPFDMLRKDGKITSVSTTPIPASPASHLNSMLLICCVQVSFSPESGLFLCTFTCSNRIVVFLGLENPSQRQRILCLLLSLLGS